MQTMYVPKWTMVYEVGGIEYEKEALGSSHSVIMDKLGHCSKNHGLVDKLKRHDQQTYCICENCYKAFLSVPCCQVQLPLLLQGIRYFAKAIKEGISSISIG